MAENASLWAFQTLRESGVVTSVLVLCILWLIWGAKKILSDKDKALERKNAVIDKKDAKIEELVWVTVSFTKIIEKLVDTVEKNHARNEAFQEKILWEMQECKNSFNSLSSRIKWSNT